jgi:L-alanine-DL-glutamate epimerase-like enolase superfamily enzyme
MPKLSVEARIERLGLRAPFRISGYVFDHAQVVVVTLSDGTHRGRGEGAGVYYMGDDSRHMLAEIERCRPQLEAGITRTELQLLMPPGGARNALDCALWELEAARTATPVSSLAGVGEPRPLITTFTLGAEAPETMAVAARGYAEARAIKLKLAGELELDVERVRAVREARPDVWLGVDANQGFDRPALEPLVGALADERVSLLEQPLARGHEADLEGFDSPIPIAADESVLALSDVDGLVGRFQVVNIKLDKCGGLTEALAMAARARELGLQVMVGNMIGTSLAMAPAFILGQLCDFVDLDGPTFLEVDRNPGATYRDGTIWCDDTVWGSVSRRAA